MRNNEATRATRCHQRNAHLSRGARTVSSAGQPWAILPAVLAELPYGGRRLPTIWSSGAIGERLRSRWAVARRLSLRSARGIVERAVRQHRHENAKPAISDTTQRAAVRMAARP